MAVGSPISELGRRLSENIYRNRTPLLIIAAAILALAATGAAIASDLPNTLPAALEKLVPPSSFNPPKGFPLPGASSISFP